MNTEENIDNNSEKQYKITIATLNCRGLKKSNSRKKRQQFIRFLRLSGCDILLLQETHADSNTIIDQFNMQFQTDSSIWTAHCGIISLNKNIHISLIESDPQEGRYILADIHHNNLTTGSPHPHKIATVLNIYGPASTAHCKDKFYNQLISSTLIREHLHASHAKTIIMGDLNYKFEDMNHQGSIPGIPPEWIELLHNHFQDDKLPTWFGPGTSSVIDYIYCHNNVHHNLLRSTQSFVTREWTDHAMLQIEFSYRMRNDKGPGAWKANPLLAANPTFRSALAAFLESHLPETLNTMSTFCSPQEQWNWIKADIKEFIRTFQIAIVNGRREELRGLQKLRNKPSHSQLR